MACEVLEEELKVVSPRADHPIIVDIMEIIANEVYACDYDDYEVCEYEAKD